MKKKLVAIITTLVIVLSLSLVACGDGEERADSGVLAAAPAVTSIVSSNDVTATAAYASIPSQFHSLLYLRNGETVSYTNEKPLVLTANDASAVFTFASTLSLSKLNKDVNFIEFVVIPTNYDPTITSGLVTPASDFATFEVTLTQVSDPTKTMTFRTINRPDNNYESCGLLGGNGQSYQGKYIAAHNGSFFQSGYGTQLAMNLTGINPGYAGGYSVDPTENAGYAFPARHRGQQILRDLDRDSDLNGDLPWDGFTDDEVSVSVRMLDFSGETPGRVAILSFNGARLGEGIEDITAPVIEPANGYDEATMGEKGKTFPVPAFTAYDDFDGVIKTISTKVYKNYGATTQTECTVTNGKFTPDAAGVYAIEATASDAAGNVGKKVVYVTVSEKLTPLTVKLEGELPTSVKMGENVTCPGATVSGGTTGKGYDLIVTDKDGNDVEVDFFGRFLASKQGTYRIRYSVYDYLDNRVNYDYYCLSEINAAPIVEWPMLPTTVAKNYVVDIPEFKAEDWYSYLSPVDAVVTAYLKKPGEAEFTKLDGTESFSSDALGANVLKLEVRAHKGTGTISQEYPFTVVDSQYVRDYFVTENMTIKNIDSYIRFVPDAANVDSSTSFINPLMLSAFDIKYTNYTKNSAAGVEDGYSALNYVKVVITDKNDPTRTLTVTTEGTTRYEGAIKFAGVTYTTTDSSFDSTGSFTISVKDGYLTNNGSKIAKIKTYDNGAEYNGFPSGYVYVKLIVNAKRADAAVQIRSIGAHANFSYNGTDNSRPVVKFNGTLSTTTEVGEVVSIPEAMLFDIFSGRCNSVTTISKDGQTIVSHSGAVQFTATEHGVYNLKVEGSDASGNRISYSANIYCNNLTKPVITMKGAVPEWGTVDKKITLTLATAVDSAGNDITVHVNAMRPGGSAISPTAYEYSEDGKTVSFTPDRPGKWVIYYHAFDADYNSQWLKFFIEVTEK